MTWLPECKSSLLWNFNFKLHMHVDGGHRQKPIDFQRRHFLFFFFFYSEEHLYIHAITNYMIYTTYTYYIRSNYFPISVIAFFYQSCNDYISVILL